MTEQSPSRRWTIAAVALATLTFGVAVMGVAVADPVSSGSIVYVTDSGLEVTDASEEPIANGTFFADANTLTLPSLNVSAPGSATLTIDARNDSVTAVSAVTGLDSLNITLTPTAATPIVLISGIENVSYGPLVYDVSTAGTDLTYDAAATATIVISETDLAAGATVEAIDSDTEVELATGVVDENGAVELSGLPSGSHAVDLQDPATAPTPGGGDSGGSEGSGDDSGAGGSSGGASSGGGGSTGGAAAVTTGGDADAGTPEGSEPGVSTVTSLAGTDTEVRLGDGTDSSGSAIVSVGFRSDAELTTRVGVGTIRSMSSSPSDTTFIGAADIRFPTDTDTDTIREIRMTVRTASVEARGLDPATLAIYHYDADAADWERLDTDRERVGTHTVLTATPVGFSVYGVFAVDEPVATPTPEPTPTPATPAPSTDAPVDAEAPQPVDPALLIGAVGVAALILLAVLFARRE